MSIKYTIDELIVSRAAREINDGDIVIIGQGIPMASGVLARKTHAPRSVIVTEAGIVDPDPFKVPLHIADASCTQGYSYGCDMYDIFTSLLNQGYADIAFLGVGQIDRYGNVNSSYIGKPDDFEMRLPGAGGAPEFAGYAKKTVYTMRGGSFVEELDYFTSPGYLSGGNSRYEAGMLDGSGPAVLISAKGAFKFHPDTKEMYLHEIHPGFSVDEVTSEIPWDINVADELKTTPLPTNKELEIIRAFAPDISMGKQMQFETIVNQVLRALQGAANNR